MDWLSLRKGGGYSRPSNPMAPNGPNPYPVPGGGVPGGGLGGPSWSEGSSVNKDPGEPAGAVAYGLGSGPMAGPGEMHPGGPNAPRGGGMNGPMMPPMMPPGGAPGMVPGGAGPFPKPTGSQLPPSMQALLQRR
jgi:hypothetical protein